MATMTEFIEQIVKEMQEKRQIDKAFAYIHAQDPKEYEKAAEEWMALE